MMESLMRQINRQGGRDEQTNGVVVKRPGAGKAKTEAVLLSSVPSYVSQGREKQSGHDASLCVDAVVTKKREMDDDTRQCYMCAYE